MLRKLLSNLPFNPGLIDQVAFYTKRLRRETSVRRLGFVMLALAMLVQMFAVLAPAQPSLAVSDNDLIRGGFASQQEGLNDCNANVGGYAGILQYFGISCAAVAAGHVQNVHSTDYNRQLYSLGRLPYGKTGEVTVTIPGLGNYYMRPLWSWDTAGPSTYTVITGTRANGTPFMLMFACGNVVIVGAPTPPPPPPPPSPPPKPPAVCPLDSSLPASDSRCQPCAYNSSIIASSAGCKPPKCPLDSSILATNARCIACPYDTLILKDSPACARCPYAGLTTYSSTSSACKPPCPYNASLTQDNAACKPCAQSQNQNDQTACLVLSKTTRNDSQNISDANGTQAKAGDQITYTLSVKNTGKATVKGFIIQENMSDVLEYTEANPDLHGGSIDAQNMVAWPAVDIAPSQTVSRQITIHIKDPIPGTTVSASNPGSFDLKMTNVYGNAVTITLPPNVVKTTEQITRELPNTGPGAGLTISFVLAVFSGYFFFRNRLLGKELDIIRQEYAAAGGI